jgi:hypothetical protein
MVEADETLDPSAFQVLRDATQSDLEADKDPSSSGLPSRKALDG